MTHTTSTVVPPLSSSCEAGYADQQTLANTLVPRSWSGLTAADRDPKILPPKLLMKLVGIGRVGAVLAVTMVVRLPCSDRTWRH